MPTNTTDKHLTETKLTETKLKQQIFKILRNYLPDVYYRKISDRFHAGILDLYICYKGKCIWLELKIHPNRLTPLQYREILAIKDAGGQAYILTAKKDVFLLQGICFHPTGGDIYIIQEYVSLETLIKEVLE